MVPFPYADCFANKVRTPLGYVTEEISERRGFLIFDQNK